MNRVHGKINPNILKTHISAPDTPESDVLSLVVDDDADTLVIDNPNDEEMDFQEATESSPATAGPPTAPTTPTQETPELAGNAASDDKPSATADEQMEAETTAEPAQAPAARGKIQKTIRKAANAVF